LPPAAETRKGESGLNAAAKILPYFFVIFNNGKGKDVDVPLQKELQKRVSDDLQYRDPAL